MEQNNKAEKFANIVSLDHVNILTSDVDACRKFYVDALGFKEGFRPEFDSAGLWLYLKEIPVLHFIQTDEELPNNSGTIDHIAFRAHDFNKFTARLKKHGVAYEDNPVPELDLHQLFCYDPHGVKIEFNFEGQCK
ncbi:MAG: VOC family protein [Gammaproteobacteria bacterium]|jgi:catechol 2,3-dioxygenase-like lactoylglutathione lyase family enzyme|nr:VOC family protein [Gammaproteobacteria bacterium]|tara:strand:+ start:1381 stop:1785 length:405 start_codon:yes stop_codon:yes gene_type:complete